MATFLLRVLLPDRPGALGAVASRIGAVRADVVAINIVGRASGRAVDEFVVDLADERHVSLLLDEIAEVDGVSVEEVRLVPAEPADRRMSAYRTAAALVQPRTPAALLHAVASAARTELRAGWAAVLDAEDTTIVASDGEAPAAPWLAAYVAGTRWFAAQPSPAGSEPADAAASAPSGAHAPAPDVAWTPMTAWDLVLIAGRPGDPLAEADRRHLSGIAAVADARWADLSERAARHNHPSVHWPPAPLARTTLDRTVS